MDRITNIQEAKERMQKSVDYYSLRIAAWNAVKRVAKKDGTDFAYLPKNFDGDLRWESNTEHYKYSGVKLSGYYKVSIWIKENGRYTEDYVSLTGSTYNDDERLRTDAETADDVEYRIAKQIERYTMWKEKDLTGLAAIEDLAAKVMAACETIKSTLKEAEEVNAHYALQDLAKYQIEHYKYC